MDRPIIIQIDCNFTPARSPIGRYESTLLDKSKRASERQ